MTVSSGSPSPQQPGSGAPAGAPAASETGSGAAPSSPTPPVKPPRDAAGQCPEDPCVAVPAPVVAVALAWVVVLIASFICFERIDAVADFVSFKLGRLPFETIWFGAAGGWLISAQGIFQHNREWRRSYDYWHYVRPILGALIGTFGCLIVIVLTDAAAKEHVAANAVFYDAVALAIGYREASFRELIARLVDTVILPGEKKEPATGEQPAGGAAGGASSAAGQKGDTANA